MALSWIKDGETPVAAPGGRFGLRELSGGGWRCRAVLKGEAEDWARGRPLLGKRLQRHFRSGVSQLSGSLVEGNLVARGVILADLIGQAHHRVWIPQSYSLPKQFHGLIDAVLSATLLVQE